MKNRVAAQTARDRKKTQMDDMESRVDKLNSDLRKARSMVHTLQETNLKLSVENNKLHSTLSHCTCTNNLIITNNKKNDVTNEYEIKVDGSGIIDSSNHIVVDDDCVLVDDDSVNSNNDVAGVRIPVSIECVESTELRSQQRTKTQSIEAVLWILVLAAVSLQFSNQSPPSAPHKLSIGFKIQLIPLPVELQLINLSKHSSLFSLRSLVETMQSTSLSQLHLKPTINKLQLRKQQMVLREILMPNR